MIINQVPDPYIQDPDEKLDYTINWSVSLGTDTIQTSSWSVPPGLTEGPPASSNTPTTTTIWLRSGVLGNYVVVNTITTAGGRTYEGTIRVRVRPN